MSAAGQQAGGAHCAGHGDEIYFHKAGQPVSGKVVAVGRHGCTVEHQGAKHRVRWEHVAGHKKRAPLTYTVLEEGEDGLIVGDQHGRRRLVQIPPESRANQLELEKPVKNKV